MSDGVRLDKWLWAARFFKTRALAKKAVEGGKVLLQGSRVKTSKEIHLDHILLIKQGPDEKTVVVTGLSDRRGSATEAAKLYLETEESISKREEARAHRKAVYQSMPVTDKKPTKKERRQIIRFKSDSISGHEDNN